MADTEVVLRALTAAAEGVGVEDNERGLWIATSEGAKPWDTLGLMQHAIHIEQARTVWNDRPD